MQAVPDALCAKVEKALGADYERRDETVAGGSAAVFRHRVHGVDLVLVAGGTFTMGFTDDDEEALDAALAGRAPTERARFVQHARRFLGPARRVEVAPFLLGRYILSSDILAALSDGRLGSDALRREEIADLASMPFRLPSEAELEWVAREGGATSFVCRLDEQTRGRERVDTSTLVNAWGFDALLQGEWAADDWHEDYEGAPADARAWTGGDPRGVFRGALPMGLREPGSLVYALACYRGRGPSDEDGGDGEQFVRAALSIP